MVWSSWSSLLVRLVTLISESNLVHGISVDIEMRLWKGFENWKYLFLDNWEYASSTMVVKCAKCIEFIFLCSTKTSSNKYAILPLDQDTLMWISMIFMQMTPAYNDCTVDTLHKSLSVRQLSPEPNLPPAFEKIQGSVTNLVGETRFLQISPKVRLIWTLVKSWIDF